MKQIRFELKRLVFRKGARDERTYSARAIAEQSGASIWVVSRLLNGSLKRLPMDDLARLCAWLGCRPGDLLKLEDTEEGQ